MHRIPSYQTSNNSYNTENRRVVLLMHGLLGCSMDWVITGRNRSLGINKNQSFKLRLLLRQTSNALIKKILLILSSSAYLLSDNGYDVWLGNSRGTTNSKNHTRLSLESREYWDFRYRSAKISHCFAINLMLKFPFFIEYTYLIVKNAI